ncbi:MAG: lysophospholipase [Caldimonas manganoxidans]|nr:lysophospholipase [Caldimonas manganoxidans]
MIGSQRIVRWGLVFLAAAALLVGCAVLDTQQRRWIFQPSQASWRGAAQAAEGLEERWIEFDSRLDGQRARLHALWLPQDRSDAPILLYLHGARWDVRSSAARMRRLHGLGFAVLGIDYRGFGQSSGELPSERLAYEDARAAWDWLAHRHRDARRFIYGHSLGGAIATHLASQVDDAAGLIVEASFPSIRDVVSTFRWGWLPVGPLLTQRFEAGEHIQRVRAPVLVVHGSADRFIPPALGHRLYERAPPPKRWLLVEGASHHNASALGRDAYRAALQELFGLQQAPDMVQSALPPRSRHEVPPQAIRAPQVLTRHP